MTPTNVVLFQPPSNTNTKPEGINRGHITPENMQLPWAIVHTRHDVADNIRRNVEWEYSDEIIEVDKIQDFIYMLLEKKEDWEDVSHDCLFLKKSLAIHLLEGRWWSPEIKFVLLIFPDSTLELLAQCDERNRLSDGKVRMLPWTNRLLDEYYKMRLDVKRHLPPIGFCRLIDHIMAPYKK